MTHAVKRIKNRDANTERKTKLVIAELKTRKSRRTLCLTPELVDALKRHKSVHNKERLQAGGEWTEHGLIFPTSFGNPSDPDTFSHLFSKLAQKAGLGHWHPHELRHSGTSLMLAQGTPLHVVSDVLGHASIAIRRAAPSSTNSQTWEMLGWPATGGAGRRIRPSPMRPIGRRPPRCARPERQPPARSAPRSRSAG